MTVPAHHQQLDDQLMHLVDFNQSMEIELINHFQENQSRPFTSPEVTSLALMDAAHEQATDVRLHLEGSNYYPNDVLYNKLVHIANYMMMIATKVAEGDY